MEMTRKEVIQELKRLGWSVKWKKPSEWTNRKQRNKNNGYGLSMREAASIEGLESKECLD